MTSRLEVEPLTAAHSDELFDPLNDALLHTFVGGEPLTREQLTARCRRLAVRRSPDGSEVWANWALRERGSGQVIGTLQATLPAGGPSAGFAQVAWVVASRWQGVGLAKEAASELLERLVLSGWTVAAHIHPRHLASQGVARSAAMVPTTITQDGETRWLRTPARTPPRTPPL